MPRRKRLRTEGEFRGELAERVTQLRAKSQWSQQQLSSQLERFAEGWTRMRVYRLENQLVPTTLGLIEELAAGFDMSIIEFLAPILGEGSGDLLQKEAERRQEKEFNEWLEEILEAQRIQQKRQQQLVRLVATVISELGDAELEYVEKWWDARLAYLLHFEDEKSAYRQFLQEQGVQEADEGES
jgi:transcriptional regulator with XRE-family HTH domain